MSFFYGVEIDVGEFRIIETYENPICQATQDPNGNVAINITLGHIYDLQNNNSNDLVPITIENQGDCFTYNVIEELLKTGAKFADLGRHEHWIDAASYFEEIKSYL